MIKLLNWMPALFDKRGGIILTGAGVAFDVSCAVTTGKACIRANRIIEAKMDELDRELTAKEKIDLTWHLFLLPISLGAAGAACHVGTNVWYASQNKKAEAALLSLAAGTETAYTRLKEEVPEVVGKNKAAKIDERVAQRAGRENLPKNDAAIEMSRTPERYGPRNTLFCMEFDGRFFWSNTEEIIHSQNVIQEMQNSNSSESVQYNEFWYEQGLEGSKIGEMHAWTYDYDGLVSFSWYGSDVPYVSDDGTEHAYLIVKMDPNPRLTYTD